MAAPSLILDRNGAVFERHTYRHDGLNPVAWIIRPPGPGPFPLLVQNHGSGIGGAPDGTLTDVSSRYTVDPENPFWARVASSGAFSLFPEGRGYGGSEGPSPLEAARRGIDATFDMLLGRAADANAAADWACARPDVDGARCAIIGASHGGVVSLLAASQRAYGAVVAQATGAAYGHTEASVRPIANAAARITAPVLFQHMRTDTLVPPEGARHIFEWSSRLRPRQRWRDYPGTLGIEGHHVFDPANVQQMRPDAPRWVGRFGADGPDAAVVLDGERVVYAWKDDNSRGYGEGRAARRGDALHIEPWPGVSVLLEPLPGNAFQVTYERQGERSVARLDPFGRR